MDIKFVEEVTFEKLVVAWRRFRLGKSRRTDVIAFERDLERNLSALLSDLERGTYRYGAYQSFELKDSKRRRIDKATVRDRIVHELLFRSLEVVFEPLFISDSFSSRTGKGTLCALARADEFLSPWRDGAPDWYAIVGDIRSFFASVPHDLLLALVTRRVNDPRLLDLLEEIIGSFSTPERLGYGIPLGNVTSQIFANIVLHELDWQAKMWLRLPRYLRYNDDILVIVRGCGQAENVGKVLQGKAQEMGFDLKVRALALTKGTRFDWLGATHHSPGRNVRRASAKRIVRALKKGIRQVRRRSITENTYRSMLTSYRAHMKAYGS